jgi:hypothetical protein
MKPFLRNTVRPSFGIKTDGCCDTALEVRSFCDERPFNLPMETTIALAGETREESLEIAELLLRGHKPPKILAEPAKVQQTPLAKFAIAPQYGH